MGLIMFTVGLILAFGGAVAQVLVSENASLRASWVMGRYTVVVVGIVLIVLGLHSMLPGNGFAPNLPGR
jgi:cadmium resistance protein CadD (predicted permease)